MIKTTIIVFKARDGLWSYCPEQVRNWLAFNFNGQFKTADEALAAVKRATDCKDFPVKVEVQS